MANKPAIVPHWTKGTPVLILSRNLPAVVLGSDRMNPFRYFVAPVQAVDGRAVIPVHGGDLQRLEQEAVVQPPRPELHFDDVMDALQKGLGL